MRACEEDDGQAVVPGDEVPRDGAEQAGTSRSPGRGVPSPGSMVSETVWATFWPRNAPTKFMTAAMASATRGLQRAGRDRGGDRVGRVVEAVGVVEHQGDDDDRDDDRDFHRGQDSLTAICSTMLATFSKASIAPSRDSTMSLSLSTSMRLVLAAEEVGEDAAVADLSPVFSRRLISIQYSSSDAHRLAAAASPRRSARRSAAAPRPAGSSRAAAR